MKDPQDSHPRPGDLKIGKPKDMAGGIPAVLSALQHLKEEMGILRGLSALTRMNQKDGFDCPGCAWPDPDDKRSVLAEYCENGAKALAEEATLKRVDPAFFASYSVEQLKQGTDYWIGKQGRLTHPMLLRKGASHYEPIGWEEAFALIADHLQALDSPDEAIFYTSGRTSNEAAFLYQLFVRMYGTNNLPDCSNMCHESSGQGLSQTVGIGKGSVTLDDIYEAEVVMVVGQNPGTNHPRMLSALQKCKAKGGKIITVNPLPETGLISFKHPQSVKDMLGEGTALTNVFLQVQVNGDVALAKALMKLLLEAEEKNPEQVLDHDFIASKTKGFEALQADLAQENLADLIQASGVGEQALREAAQLLIEKKKIIICWAMGLTQHPNGVDNIKAMVNLLLLKGSIGKPGAGTCPVRGHSNVQGDRTMGIWEKPKPAFLDKLQEEFVFEPPRHHGYDTVHAIEAMHSGKAKVFFAMGGNFLSASPDTDYTAQALENCSLTVQVSTKLNRSHLVHGETALILPCLARSERDLQASGQQFVSMENSMGKIHRSMGDLLPASKHLLSEPDIVCRLAVAVLGDKGQIAWAEMSQNYDLIRDKIEACIPGFEDYNQRVRQENGFYLPNGAREGKFNTPDGKAHFSVMTLPEDSRQEGQYFMMTVRSHDQYNTTIYGLDDRYRGIYQDRRVILMNREDMKREGLEAEQLVDLASYFAGEVREARHFRVVPFDIPARCTATYFPEANVLVPIGDRARGSNTPSSKRVVISLKPS